MVWIQIRPDILGPNYLQRPSADDKSLLARKRVFFQNSFGNIIRVSNGLDPDQDRQNVCPDLCPIYLQRPSADSKSGASKEKGLKTWQGR